MSWHFKFIAIFYSIFIAIVAMSRSDMLITDEFPHFPYVEAISRNEKFAYSNIVGIFPGYHYIIATVFGPLGLVDLKFLRFTNLLLNMACVGVFYKVLKSDNEQKSALNKTLKLATMPFFIVYSTLVYTDTFSVLFLTLFLYFYSRGKTLPALASILMTFISRHNNIVPLMAGMVLFSELNLFDRAHSSKIKNFIVKNFAYILSCSVLILGYLFYSGGFVATGSFNQKYFPAFYWGLGNITFFFFSFFFIFFPQNIFILGNTKVNFKTISYLCFFSFVIFILSTYFQKELHTFNWLALEVNVRNMILVRIHTDIIAMILYSFITYFGIISFYSLLKNENEVIIFTTLILLLGLSWTIDIRYYLPILLLFIMVQREVGSNRLQRAQIIYGATFSLLFAITTHASAFVTF